MPSFKGAVERFELSSEVFTGLMSLARSERATVFMVLLGAFQVLLGRYSRQTDIVVGTAIAGRTQRASEGLIRTFRERSGVADGSVRRSVVHGGARARAGGDTRSLCHIRICCPSRDWSRSCSRSVICRDNLSIR